MKNFFLYMFITIMATLICSDYFGRRYFETALEDAVVVHYRDLLKGPFNMLTVKLKALPDNERLIYLKSLEPEFGLDLNLVPLHQTGFSSSEINTLLSGKILVGKNTDLFYSHLPGSDQVLCFGPFFSDQQAHLLKNIAVWAGFTFFVAIFSLLWVGLFGWNLSKVRRAAIAFGNGDFNQRAKVSKRSYFSPLAATFNKMADKIQQLLISQKELTNAVSHDLRTPISRLRFGLEMLSIARTREEGKKHVDGILSDIDQLDALAAEVVVYAGFEREKPDLAIKSVCLHPWIEELVHTWRPGPGLTACKISILPDADNINASLDPRHFGRAVNNLIQNALHHAKGRVAVSLCQEGAECVIHVDDDGPGIPVKDRSAVFEPFVRLDTS
ncbi:MAG: hypothetical protein HKM93_17320, partial [Desulfobacteraceae bacterium]|nr:hypothetical protein [Desulfobacteraceae bacterium]